MNEECPDNKQISNNFSRMMSDGYSNSLRILYNPKHMPTEYADAMFALATGIAENKNVETILEEISIYISKADADDKNIEVKNDLDTNNDEDNKKNIIHVKLTLQEKFYKLLKKQEKAAALP